jgi:CheY-like chemotaxis protein
LRIDVAIFAVRKSEHMRKRILVVDDEPGMAHVFGRALSDYEIRAESDPKAAIKTAKEFRPDVLLLDLIMPDIPGNVLAEKIRGEPELRKVPIIFISAAVHTRNQEEEPVWIGPYPAFGKPFSIRALRRCIAEQIGEVDSSDCGESWKRGSVDGF